MTWGDTLARCFGKDVFTSGALANKIARRMTGAHAYRCHDCGKWHVGHRKKIDKLKRRTD